MSICVSIEVTIYELVCCVWETLGVVKTEFSGFSKNDSRDVLVYLFRNSPRVGLICPECPGRLNDIWILSGL